MAARPPQSYNGTSTLSMSSRFFRDSILSKKRLRLFHSTYTAILPLIHSYLQTVPGPYAIHGSRNVFARWRSFHIHAIFAGQPSSIPVNNIEPFILLEFLLLDNHIISLPNNLDRRLCPFRTASLFNFTNHVLWVYPWKYSAIATDPVFLANRLQGSYSYLRMRFIYLNI